MTSTTPGNPLVRSYLEQLDDALGLLPPEKARELREQITTHLEDALPAGAGDPEVAEVLRRLGQPADLAAEAAQTGGPAQPARPAQPAGLPVSATPPAQRRSRLAAPPWLPWSVSLFIAAVIIGAGYLTAVESAPSLQSGGASGWWYLSDSNRSVWTPELTGENVFSAPIRSGQMQGILITVVNNSDWTQTVLGPAPYMITPGGVFGVRIAVAGYDLNVERGGLTRSLRFTSPGSIPPHQTRALRVLWRTTICQRKGGSTLVNALTLRVRVGGVTRTELVLLNDIWTLTGASPPPNARGYCV